MARDFELQADLNVLRNTQLARAMVAGDIPPAIRLDHDIADSRGTLVDVRSLDKMWFPQLARAIKPLVDAAIYMTQYDAPCQICHMVVHLKRCPVGQLRNALRQLKEAQDAT